MIFKTVEDLIIKIKNEGMVMNRTRDSVLKVFKADIDKSNLSKLSNRVTKINDNVRYAFETGEDFGLVAFHPNDGKSVTLQLIEYK